MISPFLKGIHDDAVLLYSMETHTVTEDEIAARKAEYARAAAAGYPHLASTVLEFENSIIDGSIYQPRMVVQTCTTGEDVASVEEAEDRILSIIDETIAPTMTMQEHACQTVMLEANKIAFRTKRVVGNTVLAHRATLARLKGSAFQPLAEPTQIGRWTLIGTINFEINVYVSDHLAVDRLYVTHSGLSDGDAPAQIMRQEDGLKLAMLSNTPDGHSRVADYFAIIDL